MRDANMTLDDIAEATGLTRERVRQILDRPPAKPGRPRSPQKVERMRQKLARWEQKRQQWTEQGKVRLAAMAEQRVAAISEELSRA